MEAIQNNSLRNFEQLRLQARNRLDSGKSAGVDWKTVLEKKKAELNSADNRNRGVATQSVASLVSGMVRSAGEIAQSTLSYSATGSPKAESGRLITRTRGNYIDLRA